MSQAALVSASAPVPSYGTNQAVPNTTSSVTDLTQDLGKKSPRELALFIGKVALVALVIAVLAAACVFTGGLAVGAAAAGMGVGIAFLKCFALSAAALASGGTAGMLFIGTAMKINDKISGTPETEANKKVREFYLVTSVGIACESLILTLGGIVLLPLVAFVYDKVKAKEDPKSEVVATNIKPKLSLQTNQTPVPQTPANVGQSAASPTLRPSKPQPTAGELHYDKLLSRTHYADLTKARNALEECTVVFRNQVYGQIWHLTPEGVRDASDPIWGENHAFDDAQILERAIREAYQINPNILPESSA